MRHYWGHYWGRTRPNESLIQGWSREGHWTESIAVGSSSFIEETKSKLGCRARGRTFDEQKDGPYFLKEEGEPYTAGFAGKVRLFKSK
jgi:putative transposase